MGNTVAANAVQANPARDGWRVWTITNNTSTDTINRAMHLRQDVWDSSEGSRDLTSEDIKLRKELLQLYKTGTVDGPVDPKYYGTKYSNRYVIDRGFENARVQGDGAWLSQDLNVSYDNAKRATFSSMWFDPDRGSYARIGKDKKPQSQQDFNNWFASGSTEILNSKDPKIRNAGFLNSRKDLNVNEYYDVLVAKGYYKMNDKQKAEFMRTNQEQWIKQYDSIRTFLQQHPDFDPIQGRTKKDPLWQPVTYGDKAINTMWLKDRPHQLAEQTKRPKKPSWWDGVVLDGYKLGEGMKDLGKNGYEAGKKIISGIGEKINEFLKDPIPTIMGCSGWDYAGDITLLGGPVLAIIMVFMLKMP